MAVSAVQEAFERAKVMSVDRPLNGNGVSTGGHEIAICYPVSPGVGPVPLPRCEYCDALQEKLAQAERERNVYRMAWLKLRRGVIAGDE